MAADTDLVTIATCGDATEATLLKSMLEGEGIFCYVQGEAHRQLLGVLGSYIEPRLMVAGVNAERALSLVNEFRSAEPSDDDLAEQALKFVDAEPGQGDPYRNPAPTAKATTPKSPRRALVYGLILGLGCGHRSAGARWRGNVLALADLGTLAALFAGAVSLGFGVGLLGLLHLCDGVGGYVAAADQNRLPHDAT